MNYKFTYTHKVDRAVEILGYVDANYGRDLDTQRLTSGYVFMLAEGAVS